MWLKVEGFRDLIKEWWQKYKLRGGPSSVLVKELLALKKDLKKRNKKVFGNVTVKKEAALEMINYWDSIERVRPLSERDRNQWLGSLFKER